MCGNQHDAQQNDHIFAKLKKVYEAIDNLKISFVVPPLQFHKSESVHSTAAFKPRKVEYQLQISC